MGEVRVRRDRDEDGADLADLTDRRVLILALGTRGDVEPAGRLATVLRLEGAEVAVAVFADGGDRVRTAGARSVVVGPPAADAMGWRSPAARTLAQVNPGIGYLQLRSRIAVRASSIAATLVPWLATADVVLCGLATARLVPVLDRLGIPARLVLHAPLVPHRGGASGWDRRPARLLPRRAEAHRQEMMWRMTTGLSQAVAAEVAHGLGTARTDGTNRTARTTGAARTTATASASRTASGTTRKPTGRPHQVRGRSLHEQLADTAYPPLLATSDVLDPEPAPLLVQTGWWPDPTPVRPLPPQLEAWLDAHPRAVLLTHGSLPLTSAKAHVTRLLGAARDVGRPAVVQVAGVEPGLRPGAILVGDVDHRALLPRVDVILHHGGSGTTHAATAAGVPQVLLPQLGDQPHYARQVHRLGLGPAPLPVARATRGSLARRLAAALALKKTARARAEMMAGQDGLSRAVTEVRRMVR